MSQPAVSGTGLITGEAVVLDIRPARLGSRSIATLIDYVGALLALALVGGALSGFTSGDPRLLRALLIVGILTFAVGYPVIALTYFHGRTVGKAILGIRVVRADGGTVRARHAAVRTLVGLVEFPLGLAVIASLCSRTGRRLGDMFAGTAVVHDRIPLLGRQVLVMPPPLVQWALSADVSGVDERLATDVRSFLGRAPLLRTDRRWELSAAFANAVVAKVSPPPPAAAPPEHVLHAVMAERQRRQVMRAGPVQLPYGIPGAGAEPAYRMPPAQAPAPHAPPPPPPPPGQDTGGFTLPS